MNQTRKLIPQKKKKKATSAVLGPYPDICIPAHKAIPTQSQARHRSVNEVLEVGTALIYLLLMVQAALGSTARHCSSFTVT